jgi:hypothetical protein
MSDRDSRNDGWIRTSWKVGGLLAAALVTMALAAEALASPSPPKASVADRTIYGGITFDLGKGVRIKVHGAGAGDMSGSHCSKNESEVFAVTTTAAPVRKVIHFVAKNDGGCFIARSWSNFIVTASTITSKDFRGEGRLFLGQTSAGGNYHIGCWAKVTRDGYAYQWKHLRCQKTGEFELLITREP